MLFGMWLRINAIPTFEQAVTEVNAIHITKVTCRLVVTAKAEHTPKICTAIGFCEKTGSEITDLSDIKHPQL
jgi:hypothetical protein